MILNVQQKMKWRYVEGYFNSVLSLDEIVILSNLMMTEWLTRQIMTTENIRQKSILL